MSPLPIPAGLGWHLPIPELDFETYSEAGHHWDESRQRYTAPPPVTTSKKKGLPTVGAAKYAMHPSTEILSAQYNLLDGHGNTLWIPDLPKPERLIEHVLRGGLLEAWNAGFEYWIWQYVATRRYGWPAIGMRQFRCAMAKARAFSLPGKLEEAGRVLALPIQKDAEGKRLLKLFSEPRTPTKKDPRHRILPSEAPADAAALYRYNGTDIDAERAVSEVTPDLDGLNLDYWFADQDINRRGVNMDAESIRAATLIVNEAHERYNIELREVTTGAVSKASELAKLVAWMHGRGVHTDTLDEDVISALLETELPDDVRRALEIRAAIGSAAVKKLYAMADQLAPTGRLHDLFSYHAARTGRPTGNGPQPTNLPKAGPKVHECKPCGRYFGGRMLACPHCGALRAPGKPQEWSPEAAEDALEVIRTGSLDALEYVFGDAMLTIAGCLRGLFVAAPGHDLIASDYSAIEAVVLAALAGVEWRLEVFRTHGRIYEDSVARITGTPFAEIMAHAGYDVSKPEWWLEKQSGPHHPLRQTVGKVAELACFEGSTLVLTNRGYVPIILVEPTDLLWDGIEWVTHAGVVPKGQREIIGLDGIGVTPNHPISLGHSWREAKLLASNASILSRALGIGSANLPFAGQKLQTAAGSKKFGPSAIVGPSEIPRPSRISWPVKARGATLVQNAQPYAPSRTIGPTPTYSLTTGTADGCSIGSLPQSNVATTQKMPATRTTAAVGSKFGRHGERIEGGSSHISSPCPGGMFPRSNSIVSRSMGDTNLETCGSLPSAPTSTTDVAFKNCNDACSNSKAVFDIAHAGPRNRFTIKTASGHLIVHNSGFKGWVGAWKAFGADEFMTEDEIKTAILAWREASPEIVEFWGGQRRYVEGVGLVYENFGVEGAFVSAMTHRGQSFSHRGISFVMQGDAVFCTLLSGRHLTYHRPRLEPSHRTPGTWALSFEGWNTNPKQGQMGWVTMTTGGGKLTENIVQATAHDLQRFAVLNQEAAGYPIVLHIYDENVSEVPRGFGSIQEFERLMMLVPKWAEGWPVKAAGGWRSGRYRKA